MANYRYNGVELPALPEWDKDTYPYASIVGWTNSSDGSVYGLVLSESKLAYNEDSGQCSQYYSGDGDCLLYNIFEGSTEWEYARKIWFGRWWGTVLEASPIWSNHNVCTYAYVDGSFTVYDNVYLAASDPVPVTQPINRPEQIRKGILYGLLMSR